MTVNAGRCGPSEQGKDARPLVTADPDQVTLTCRHCGQPFTGRAGWRPVCKRCWETARGHYCQEPCPPCRCPSCACRECQARWRATVAPQQIGGEVFPYFTDDQCAAHPNDGRVAPDEEVAG